MGFRFRKSIKAGPVRINLSKSGVGYSVGGKGFRYSKKAGGGTRTTASIPGTGISYVKDSGSGSNKRTPAKSSAPASITPAAPPAQISDNMTRYCKHCYRRIEAGVKFCPACGKPQNEQIASPRSSKKAMWSVICLVIGLICLSFAPLLALILMIISIALGISLVKDKKRNVTVASVPETKRIDESTKAQADAIVQALREETLRQASGETEVAIEVKRPEPKTVPAPTTAANKGRVHHATGMAHYLDNILELAIENPDYDLTKKEIIDNAMEGDKIWKYEFYPTKTELVPEPDNPYDPNAIKVVVDGQHVAYIKSRSCSALLKKINSRTIHRLECEIGGGPYKEVYEDDDGNYEIERGERNYFVRVTVYSTSD